MTRISEIHGLHQIPADEYAGRGAMVKPNGYIPYLSLTQGEMKMWLAAQRAKLMADWYGSDAPQYRQAYQMLENALTSRMRGIPQYAFMGSIPNELMAVAQLIRRAENQNRPASRGGFMARDKVAGVGQIIPYQDRQAACLAEANKITDFLARTKAKIKCNKLAQKEKIVNNNLVGMSPHMLYKSIPKGYPIPTAVETHRTLHRLGVEGIAGVGEITDYGLVYQWIENGILEKNTQGGAGLIGSVQSSFYLAPDPDAAWSKFLASSQGSKNKWISGHARIGDPVVVGIIVSIVTAAIAAAFQYLTDIRKTEILAMSEARGFGTPEYSANQSDWLVNANNPETAGGLSSTTMLALGAAALLLLTADN